MSSLWTGRALALVAVVFWGATYVWAKTVLLWLPPFIAAALRYGTAAVLLVLIALRRGRFRSALRRHWRFFLLQGVIGLAMFQGLLFSALRLSSAVSVSVVMALTPIVTALSAALFAGERLTARAFLGIVVSVAGAVLAVLGANPRGLAGMSLDWGAPLALGSTLCMAFYTTSWRRFSPGNIPGTTSTALILVLGAVFLVPPALSEKLPVVLPPLHVLGDFAALVIGSTVIGYLAWNESVRRLGVGVPNLLYNFVPLVTIGHAWLTGTPPWPEQLIGALLVVFGVSFGLTGRAAKLR